MYIIFVLLDTLVWKKGVATDPQNLRNILSQTSYTGIIAVGMTLVIIGGGIDLSVGSLLGLLGVLSVAALNKFSQIPLNPGRVGCWAWGRSRNRLSSMALSLPGDALRRLSQL